MKHRPLSPHLQIYNIFAKELTSAMSITHRAAELGVFISLFYLVTFFLAIALGENTYNLYIQFITSWFGWLSIFGISLCLWFYIFSAIRFALFSIGFGINKKFVMISGYISLVCSLIGLLISWYIIYLKVFL